MKHKKPIIGCALLIIISIVSCKVQKANNPGLIRPYIAADTELYREIVAMDSIFFNAYNSCDLNKQASIYSDNIEFYHDKGGLMTSKQDIMDGTEKNICGKVTREVLKESIEVYPIKGYGAVQIGFHKFHNKQEPDATSYPSKFIIIWQNVNDSWRITKVVSLH
tara:strand:+ start:1436 stop:1927 length:492 start_codon:yes stop_codon:yes gene_type:complete